MESHNPVMFQTTKQLWMCLDVNWDVYAYGILKIKLVKGDQPSLFEPWRRIGSRFAFIQLSVQVRKMEGLHDIKTYFGSTYIYIYTYTYNVYMGVCIYTLYISRYIHLTYGRHLQVRYLKCPVMKRGGYDGDGSIHLGKNAYHVIPTFLCV